MLFCFFELFDKELIGTSSFACSACFSCCSPIASTLLAAPRLCLEWLCQHNISDEHCYSRHKHPDLWESVQLDLILIFLNELHVRVSYRYICKFKYKYIYTQRKSKGLTIMSLENYTASHSLPRGHAYQPSMLSYLVMSERYRIVRVMVSEDRWATPTHFSSVSHIHTSLNCFISYSSTCTRCTASV